MKSLAKQSLNVTYALNELKSFGFGFSYFYFYVSDIVN